MAIYLGDQPPSAIYLGVQPVSAIYLGDQKIWPTSTPDPVYTFYDDFNRTTIGAAWTGAGAVIVNGELKKNATNGSADYYTATQFATDDLDVTAVVGTVTDPAQRASILLGSPAQYIYAEVSANGGIIGDYNGSVWTTRANVPAGLASGDTLRLRRQGTTVTLSRNGTTIATATSSVALGPSFRRVGLSVRRDSNVLGTYYGPTWTSVGVA